jgi:3-dehydroquinate synthase
MNSVVASLAVQTGPSPERAYAIHVGRDLGGVLVRDLLAAPLGERYVLITDDTLRPLHAERLAAGLCAAGVRVDTVSFPAGETYKNRDTLARLMDRMVELAVGRDGVVLALGGGVVGDLAGFAAATYLRGIPFLQLPTTILAMVDASIGGKTGHDVPGGKNLVGAFHQPAAIYADLNLLNTLPAAQRRAGYAEVVKHAFIADEELLTFLEAHTVDLVNLEPVALERAILDAMRVKVDVVSSDAREEGRRAILNFGHTVGHAVESVSGYRISHGEAVAMGMVSEAGLAVRRGLLEDASLRRLRRLLEGFGLPTSIPGELSGVRLWNACRRDKKVRAGRVHCVLPRRAGEMARPDQGWSFAVEEEELRDALSR